MTDREALAEAAALLLCECGHHLDYHNALGCYERLSYTPLVTCTCKLTDDRSSEDLLALNLHAHDRQVAAAAWDEGYSRGQSVNRHQPQPSNPYRSTDEH